MNNENACSPLLYMYVPLAESDPAALIKDADNDGVVDSLDQEPNSDPLASVDIHGVSLDSDGDGCLDHLDPEVHTSPVLPIENCANVKIGCTWDFGIDICRRPGNINYDWMLPWIFFDAEKADIRSDAIAPLNYIVDFLKKYPSLSIEIVGYYDVTMESDAQIALDRAYNAVIWLLNKGIDESRIHLLYANEFPELIPDPKLEKEHQLKRRVQFEIIN